jgi:tetratricopeptide (TPR) repeat protein
MYSRAKQFDRALDDYNYFLRSNPQSASTYIERSRVYADLKKFDLALKDAETAKQLGFSVDEKYLEEMKRLSSR